MFSKTCKYGIRAMIFIAQKSKDGGKVGVKEIATETDVPEHFIAKILQDLNRKGLVQSLKGPSGGFYLDKNSLRSSLADIVLAIDGETLFSGCGLGLPTCSKTQPCPIHKQFEHVRKQIYTMLQNARLDEFKEQLDKKLACLKQV
jgi:Rrf2 family protein